MMKILKKMIIFGSQIDYQNQTFESIWTKIGDIWSVISNVDRTDSKMPSSWTSNKYCKQRRKVRYDRLSFSPASSCLNALLDDLWKAFRLSRPSGLALTVCVPVLLVLP